MTQNFLWGIPLKDPSGLHKKLQAKKLEEGRARALDRQRSQTLPQASKSLVSLCFALFRALKVLAGDLGVVNTASHLLWFGFS